MKKTKAKSQSVNPTKRLIRSDERLLGLGLFSAACLTGVVMLAYNIPFIPRINVNEVPSDLYRLEIEPARINEVDSVSASESEEYMMEYDYSPVD